MALNLKIIIASTRPARVGWAVAQWVDNVARENGAFDVDLVDLAEMALPVFDEPRHPRMQQYEHEHTRAWSEVVAAGDAYVFVTPEYNHGPTPALLNALNYVYREWNYKPAGFVSYGGVSGGTRGVEAVVPTLTTLKLVPLPESVPIPWVQEHLKDGRFTASEPLVQGAEAMLTELHRWAEALKPMRP